jgi:DNA invertase Pin-like site-specific DNA recombinase
MKHIYSRVSTDKQDTENQLNLLRQKYPDAVIHEETASGAKARPVLDALTESLQSGDTLVVYRLDRLGRKMSEIIVRLESLFDRGVSVVSLKEGIDYSNIMGRALVQMICIFSEVERSLIAERTRDALASRRAQGLRCGPPIRYDAVALNQIKALVLSGQTYRQVSKQFGISIGRISQLLSKQKTMV